MFVGQIQTHFTRLTADVPSLFHLECVGLDEKFTWELLIFPLVVGVVSAVPEFWGEDCFERVTSHMLVSWKWNVFQVEVLVVDIEYIAAY